MNWEQAVEEMKAGKLIRRPEWPDYARMKLNDKGGISLNHPWLKDKWTTYYEWLDYPMPTKRQEITHCTDFEVADPPLGYDPNDPEVQARLEYMKNYVPSRD